MLIHRTRTTMPTAPLRPRNGAFMRPSAWRHKDGGVAAARDISRGRAGPRAGQFREIMPCFIRW